MNTHANGDHCYGNALVADSDIIASARCAEEMAAPATGHHGGHDAVGAPLSVRRAQFLARIFAPSPSRTSPLTVPTTTFEGRLDLHVGDRSVSLLEVGPAHTAGDVIVHLPDEDVVFTGDILFHGGHPIVWAGPVANWIAACEPDPRAAAHGRRARPRARSPPSRPWRT